MLSVKEKGHESRRGKSKKSDKSQASDKKVVESVKSESGESQEKEKSDVTKSDEAKEDNQEAKGGNQEDKQEGGDHVLFYESPRVPWKHMTVAERKRLQWARERGRKLVVFTESDYPIPLTFPGRTILVASILTWHINRGQ